VDELVEPARAEMARVDNQEVVVEGQKSNEARGGHSPCLPEQRFGFLGVKK
jgi:hypothetical protein